MSDLIDRQAAIEALGDIHPLDYYAISVRNTLRSLPSAQPEIVRCKNCYLRLTSCPMAVRHGNYLTFFTDDDFCSYGKGEKE